MAESNIVAEATSLLAAKDDLAVYAAIQKPDYELGRHLQILIDHLHALERGDFEYLMISMPPQNGKLVGDSVPVLTANRGWVTHGEIEVGDEVFSPTGQPIAVVAESPRLLANIEIETTEGGLFTTHGAHEWLLFDRARNGWGIFESRYLLEQQVWYGGKKKRARFNLPLRSALEYPERELPIDPYTLGAWLGNGTQTKPAISQAPTDMDVAIRISNTYPISSLQVHSDTGVRTAYFSNLYTRLKALALMAGKYIPHEYQAASIDQRLALLAGLIDTDGCVDAANRRVTFSNTNPAIVDGIVELVRSFGWRTTTCKVDACQSSSGIIGRKDVYQVSFSPDLAIPTVLPRKSTAGFNVLRRRIGIKAVRQTIPEPGKCITVASPDGLYLIGKELTPTHNSTTATELFPAWYMGRHPTEHVVIASYAQPKADEFGDAVRNYVSSPFHTALFPKCVVRQDSRAKDQFKLENISGLRGGSCKAVGRGGSLTGSPAHVIICDDPLKDKGEAKSDAVRKELKGWWNTVVMTRRRPHCKVVIILTRWDPEDLAGIELEKSSAARWKVLSLPALGHWTEDPRIRVPDENGDALWPETYPKDWLQETRENMDRDEWLALYQQTPTKYGDEQTFDEGWLKDKLVDLNVEQIAEMNLYILGDPANRKKKERTDYTCIWVIAANIDQNLYVIDGIYERGLDQKDRWDALVKLHKKWNPISRIRTVGWEEFGLSADVEYFERKQNDSNYRFMITPLTSKIAKEDRIKALVGLFRDGHIYFQRLIPGTIDGKYQNLTEYFLLKEYSRWPAVRHDDGLDNLSRIQDKEMNVDFPRKRNPQEQRFFVNRAKRYEQAGWMGR